MPSKNFSSPTRTYVVITNKSVAKKFILPEKLANYSATAWAYFSKHLEKGEEALVVLPFEHLDWIPEIANLEMWGQITGDIEQMEAIQKMGPKIEEVLDEDENHPLFGLIGDPPVLSTMEPPESDYDETL